MAVVLNAKFLKRVPFFKFLEPNQIAILVLCMRNRIYLPTEIAIAEGEGSAAIFFIRTGTMEVVKKVGGVVNLLGETDFFGEQSFVKVST